jgi:hypothetical protein
MWLVAKPSDNDQLVLIMCVYLSHVTLYLTASIGCLYKENIGDRIWHLAPQPKHIPSSFSQFALQIL